MRRLVRIRKAQTEIRLRTEFCKADFRPVFSGNGNRTYKSLYTNTQIFFRAETKSLVGTTSGSPYNMLPR